MELLTPDVGLIIWQAVIFLVLLLILGKFAFPNILKSIKQREASINDALLAAEKAKEEMDKLKADNEKLLQEAREERDKILTDARNYANKVKDEAKDDASNEADKIITEAKAEIENQKQAALNEIKDQVATLSIEIAEKILKQNLSTDDSQKKMVDEYIKEAKLN